MPRGLHRIARGCLFVALIVHHTSALCAPLTSDSSSSNISETCVDNIKCLGGCLTVPGGGEVAVCKAGYPCDCCECNENPCCSDGLFLGGLFTAMKDVDPTARSVVYLILLLWMFMGVGMIADAFMVAIEVITSKEKVIKTKDGKVYTVLVWNATVANLSLMALGSSAPEILLNVFEILAIEKFFAGDLGPSTIVGSAAFNLFVIAAVCVVSIPNGEARTIKDIKVFACTAFFSVFAYLWLLIILLGNSKDMVEPWEAWVTFLFFFLLLGLAYSADKNFFRKESASVVPGSNEHIVGFNTGVGALHSLRAFDNPEEVSKAIKQLRAQLGTNLSDEDLETHMMLNMRRNARPSRTAYRINATRGLTGGKPVIYNPPMKNGALIRRQTIDATKVEKLSDFQDAVFFDTPNIARRGIRPPPELALAEPSLGACAFALPQAVMENVGTFKVHVRCTAKLVSSDKVTVKYTTVPGTATKDDDYVHTEGVLVFTTESPNLEVPITIIDDVQFEPDEHFFLQLSDVTGNAKIGGHDKTTITIKNDDMPGVLNFKQSEIGVKESEGFVNVVVTRSNGCSGDISVKYCTQEMGSAVAGNDFEAVEGTLDFKHTEESKTITIKIIDDEAYEKDEKFKLALSDPAGGATLGDSKVAIITIKSDDDVKGLADKLAGKLAMNRDMYAIGSSSWKQQFVEAISMEVEDGAKPGVGAYIGFVLALPFKVVFATVPPTAFCSAWPSFFVALCYIGLVTILIGDLAGTLGMGMPNAVTAVTLVALGTSLPDTFASMAAAKGDPYADAAIGNITGSNAVNVFLGLGVPWVIGAMFWAAADSDLLGFNAREKAHCSSGDETWVQKYSQYGIPEAYPDGGFVVIAGDLGFSVTVFSICATVCLSTLVLRRRLFEAELGGPPAVKYATAAFFIGLWGVYLSMSIDKTYASLAAVCEKLLAGASS